MLTSDTHMLAFDNGYNNEGIPICFSGAMDREANCKGG